MPNPARPSRAKARPMPGSSPAEIPRASRADAERAILAARKAFDDGPWPKMSGTERSRSCTGSARRSSPTRRSWRPSRRWRSARRSPGCAARWTFPPSSGASPPGTRRGSTGETHNGLGEGTLGLMLREPIGVVGIITPWNYPLLIGSERVPWALGAGCTVVLKPSEFTSGSSIRLAELARDCGLPDGVFNVVTGYGDPVGQSFAEHPATDFLELHRLVPGRRRSSAVSPPRASSASGWNSAARGRRSSIADSDMAAAADTIASSVFGNSGPDLHRRQPADRRGGRARRNAGAADALSPKRVPIGDPLDDKVKVGSLIHRPHLEKVEKLCRGRAARGRRAGDRRRAARQCRQLLSRRRSSPASRRT